MMKSAEQWLPVPDFNGCYEVSDLGRVRSVDRVIKDRNGRAMRWRGKILAAPAPGSGHRAVVLWRAGECTTVWVHILVLTVFDRPCPEGMECRHKNGKAWDNRLSNLHWGTRTENNLDAVAHRTNWQTAKSSCRLEHLLKPPNLTEVSVRRGHRDCLACQRTRSARDRAVAKGQFFDFRAEADRRYEQIMRGDRHGARRGNRRSEVA